MLSRQSKQPDEAVICAALEREIEWWALLRRQQGSRAPGCTPTRSLAFLFQRPTRHGSTLAAAAAMRRLVARGLVRRKEFDCGGTAWALTSRGSALAQEAEPPCRECLADALAGGERCSVCEARWLDERAADEERSAAYWRQAGDEHAAEAAALRARAEELRGVEIAA